MRYVKLHGSGERRKTDYSRHLRFATGVDRDNDNKSEADEQIFLRTMGFLLLCLGATEEVTCNDLLIFYYQYPTAVFC